MKKTDNVVYKTFVGDGFFEVAKKAKEMSKLAVNHNRLIEFDFNGITCLVNPNTDIDLLYRDYSNSHTMDWKTVGADCVVNYEPKVQAELDKRNKAAEEEAEKSAKEYKLKEDKEREDFKTKTAGVEIELLDVKGWNDWKSKNTDGYGACIFEYAESWAKLMQVEMSKGKKLIDCAEKTSFELGFMGITGYMYGAAIATLAKCWKHGEVLRKWHNKEYGQEGDGVVNPALLTITTPE